MKDVAKTASLNMTVQNKDCSDVVDFDCGKFDIFTRWQENNESD